MNLGNRAVTIGKSSREFMEHRSKSPIGGRSMISTVSNCFHHFCIVVEECNLLEMQEVRNYGGDKGPMCFS